jgi:hypothetical protein
MLAATKNAGARSVRPEQLEAFYTAQYPKLVKIMVLLDATVDEARDAAQRP